MSATIIPATWAQRDRNYDLVEAPKPQSLGIQCGECGAKFEHNKAYGFVCGNFKCPIQPKVT